MTKSKNHTARFQVEYKIVNDENAGPLLIFFYSMIFSFYDEDIPAEPG